MISVFDEGFSAAGSARGVLLFVSAKSRQKGDGMGLQFSKHKALVN